MAKGKKKKKDDGPVEAAPPPRLAAKFDSEVRAAAMKEFGTPNPMAAPRLDKITVNVNMGRHLDGTKIPANIRSTVIDTLETITGQKPIVLKAKKSVSNFKVREGYETAAAVTLRRDQMWHFLDRFINLAAPRIKDFRGLPVKAFDGQGNYSFGLTEQGVFPEINMAEVNFTHGMNINLTFSNSNPARSKFVLEQLGMPFVRPEQN